MSMTRSVEIGHVTFHGLILPLKTAAFALGQLLDPRRVYQSELWLLSCTMRLIFTKFDNFLTSAHKVLINEGSAEQGGRRTLQLTPASEGAQWKPLHSNISEIF